MVTSATYVITGAAGRLGTNLCHHLVKKGHTLAAIDKEVPKLERLMDSLGPQAEKVIAVPLDLRKPGAFMEMAQALKKRWGKITGYVGAAATLDGLMPLMDMTFDQWQASWDIHVTAHWHMLQCLRPYFPETGGVACLISSQQARETSPYWGAYGLSKGAMETMVRQLIQEWRPLPHTLCAYDPGSFQSPLRKKVYPGEAMIETQEIMHKICQEITDILENPLQYQEGFYRTQRAA